MNIKGIAVNVGRALLVSALFMLLCTIFSLVDGKDSAFGPLAISCLITAIVGAFPFIFVRSADTISSLHDGFVSIVLSWLLSFIFGMLPYVLWGGEFTIINAWFESVSGYTTTGASILSDIEALPRSLILWRSSTHFIGGLGVVVFLLLVMPSASPYKYKLTNLEISSLSKEGYRYRASRTIKIILAVYISMIVTLTLLYSLAGMPVFDAVNHAFSVVATGGFSSRNSSIGAFGSPLINVITIVFMVMASLHFGLIYSAFASRSLKPLAQPATKFYLGFLLLASLLSFISLSGSEASVGKGVGETFIESVFNVAAYASTTGLAISDTASWPLLGAMMLMFCSVVCGCSGSTSGGLKSDRVVIAIQAVRRHIFKLVHPSSISHVRYGKENLSEERVQPIFVYITLYFCLLLVSALLLVMIGTGPVEAFSGAISSLGNVGVALGDLSTAGNYAAQSVAAKIIYTFNMFLGRIEIYPVLVVLRSIFEKR